ncbi:Dam family site-specific DNA-(adenine-N6)-methyltransferase [Vibrio sp. D431a]|uniref:DNA adenine methylase n=1 Tax=Vibrio sp. D431a TaxID=2837388 RepID=UPI002556CA70|nr:Dam family site-specific DNA-(adenine-N6)-methyltransferase [Vibrio sp. D431a]MDK9790602.1 Dam family site-specific DNA-(adenine-N6)-methyltransferase [Vibrio sp. D431a]
MNQPKIKTYFRWAGGKQDLAPKITDVLLSAPSCNQYHEPFCGAGTIFFNLDPKCLSHLSDINPELVSAMIAVRDHPHELLAELDALDSLKDKEGFYEVRGWDRLDSFHSLPLIKRAARFIFLQKLGFNGLWRVNKKGEYNTSYGKNPHKDLYDEGIILDCSNILKCTSIKNQGFVESIKSVKKGDLVYLDPPYVPVTASKFDYSIDGFPMSYQEKLAELCDHINEIGAYFVLSNSYCTQTKRLYERHRQRRILTRRNIARSTESRKRVYELLVSNF